MKTTIAAFLFVLALITGCGDDPIFVSSGGYPVSGTIENWQLGSGIMLKASVINKFNQQHVIMDSAYISSDGSFSLKLLFPPDYTFQPFTFPEDTACHVNVTVTPQYAGITRNLQMNVWEDTVCIGSLYRSNYVMDSLVEGQFYSWVYYVDANMSIFGSMVCRYGYFVQTTNYDFYSPKGWGKMISHFVALSDSGMTTSVTEIEPPGAKWFFRTW